jgi:hypothetical protein
VFFTGERDDEERRRISQITTHWAELRSSSTEVVRYFGPVYRYFLGIVKQPAQAEELAMLFVQRFVSQDLQRHARRENGRFREYLKVSLRNMVQDLWRQAAKDKRFFGALPGDVADRDDESPDERAESDEFDAQCHIERINAAWERLRLEEAKNVEQDGDAVERAPYYTALRLQADHEEMSVQEIADELNKRRKMPLRPENVRQIMTRARRKFGEYLLDEVVGSLPPAEHDDLEAELIALKLLPYCKAALRERQSLRDRRS